MDLGNEVQKAISNFPRAQRSTLALPAQSKVSSALSWACDLIFSPPFGRSSQQGAGRSGRQGLLKILDGLRRAAVKMVGFLMEDGQIVADSTAGSTPGSRRIVAAAGGPSRPSSSSFGLCRRAFHKLKLVSTQGCAQQASSPSAGA